MGATDDPLLIDIPAELRGRRVLVRPLVDADAPALFEAITESREHLAPWMPWAEAYGSQLDALVYIRRSHAHWVLRERLPVAFFELSSGRLLGGSGLERINWQLRSFEIGYWVRVSAQGHGYVQEAVRLLTRLAFRELGANRVHIQMDPRNGRSQRVAESAGYAFEGTLRNVAMDSTGAAADRHVYALTPQTYSQLAWTR